MMSAIRLRRLVAEDEPLLAGYDEVEFARALTRDRPVEPSIQAMRWARETSAQILDRLTEEEWTSSRQPRRERQVLGGEMAGDLLGPSA